MRTFNDHGTLVSLADASVQRPWISVARERWRWPLVQSGTQTVTGWDTEIPFSLFGQSDNQLSFSGFTTGGFLKLRPLFAAQGGSLSSGADLLSVSPACLKGSFGAGGSYFFYATWTWGQNASLMRVSRTSGSGATSLIQIPFQCVNQTSLVKRIEAVCSTSLGAVVACGTHDFDARLSTVEFYLTNSSFSTIRRLDTIIQSGMKDGEQNQAWHSHNRHCAGVFAVALDSGILVVANDTPGGRAVQFVIRNGIESQLTPCVPIDPDASDVRFEPTGLAKIGQTYLLAGLRSWPKSDGTCDYSAVYLSSADGERWSFGERNFHVSSGALRGTFPVNGGVMGKLFFCAMSSGSFNVYSCDWPASPADVTDHVISLSIDAQQGNADALSISFSPDADIAEGDILSVSAGYVNDAGAQIGGLLGKYVLTDVSRPVGGSARETCQATGIDYAGWRMGDWRSPVDTDRWSATDHQDPLDTSGRLIAKTPIRDASIEHPEWVTDKTARIVDGSLALKGLNDPFVGYAPARDDRDGMAYAKVYFPSLSPHCIPSFGFVFGASQDKFNAVVIPKQNSWGGPPGGPVLVKSNLAPVDEEKKTGGWNLERRCASILRSVLPEQYARMTADIPLTAYRPSGAWFPQNGGTYDFVTRIQGGRVQLFARESRNLPSEIASNALWSLIAEWRFTGQARQKWSSRPYWGIIAGTDTWVDRDAFGESSCGRVEAQLSAAGEFGVLDQVIGEDVRPIGGETRDWFQLSGPASMLYVGMPVRWLGRKNAYGTGAVWSEGVTYVTSWTVESWGVRVVCSGASWGPAPDDAVKYWYYTVGSFTNERYWGWGSSGLKIETLLDKNNNPIRLAHGGSTHKLGILAGGRGAFVSNDSTAVAVRFAESDGVFHGSVSNGGGNLRTAWESTSPMAAPPAWRFIFAHSRIMERHAQGEGLPQHGYMLIDDEIIRYKDESFYKPGHYAGESDQYMQKWCCCPTWYFTPNGAPKGDVTISQWSLDGNYPGDKPSNIVIPRGLLVEFVSAGSAEMAGDIQYRVASTSGSGNSMALVLDRPLETTVRTPQQWQDGGDTAIVSGRAQLGTKKALHPADSPIVFYPLPLTDPPPTEPLRSMVEVRRFDYYAGLYNSVEDDLRHVCALAGVRNPSFRSSGSFSGVLTTTPQQIAYSVSNFVVEYNGHLPSGEKRVRFHIRGGYYLLDVHHYPSPQDEAAGRLGVVRLVLSAPGNGEIVSDGEKLLAVVSVPLTDYDISRTNGTEDQGKTVSMRVIGWENLLIVEMNGLHVWTFNLEAIDYTQNGVTKTYCVKTPGSLMISVISGTQAGVQVRAQELGSRIENHLIEMGSDGLSAISTVVSDRHIMTVPTQDGGILFSRFETRPDAGVLRENIGQDVASARLFSSPGHIVVTGAEIGEHTDDQWIAAAGYSFALGNNQILDTVQDSRDEARLMVRLARQQAHGRVISCAARPWIQQEDAVSVEYSSQGDAASLQQAQHVVSASSIAYSNGSLLQRITVRKA